MSVMDAAHAKQVAASLIDRYNQAFVQKDLAALQRLSADDTEGSFTYFDNHAHCDSDSLEDHLRKLKAFFDSGAPIGGLVVEHLRAQVLGSPETPVLLITARVRYRHDASAPPVRMSAVAQQYMTEWRLAHLHFSDVPQA